MFPVYKFDTFVKSKISMSKFLQTKIIDSKLYAWDPVRKKDVVLTPEEIVRQRMLAYMTEVKNYPISLLSVEKQIKYNGLMRRYDIVVYDRNGNPWLLVECKQSDVALSQKTVEQAAYYNLQVNVPYLVLTNGAQHFVIKLDKENVSYKFLPDLPLFPE